MRTYYDIQLGDRTVTKRELAGEDLVKVGRNHIARTLLELGAATVDPLSPANPLIFSAGPFPGSSFSHPHPPTAGCKSPLTRRGQEGNRRRPFRPWDGSPHSARAPAETPPSADPKKTNASIKDYSKMLLADGIVTNFYQPLGTMGMADVQNQMGGLPVRNFSAGQLADVKAGETFKMGGQFIAPLNTGRGGEQTHACMPGCVIQCSNVYVDASGKEVVSPVEYETLGLLGSNCGLTEPDDLAGLNEICNDMGVDTIELGGMIGLLMEARLGRFGDAKFMADSLREMMRGTPNGKIWAQGTARVGEHYKVRRVPVIKRQAISAYDPRVVEATGISMMATAQGADHTAGNLPRVNTREMDLNALPEQSLIAQVNCAATDSLGLCIFGRSVTEPNTEWLANALNGALGTSLTKEFFPALGQETLKLEHEFNRRAGFTEKDDELPAFFYNEPLAPTNHVARFHGQDVHGMYERLPA